MFNRKEYNKIYSRKYRKEHPETEKQKKRHLERNKKWIEKHQTFCQECIKKWKKENPERVRKYNKKWRKNNREKIIFWNLKRRAIKLNAEGSHTFKEWEELKEKYNYMCLCCKKSEPEIKLTEDHICPLSKGGTDFIENIQPLCMSCNSKKWKKIWDLR